MMMNRKTTSKPLPLEVGERVRFAGQERRYTVQASSEHFAILTKPYNPKRSVIYTIIDWRRGIRGTEDLVFGMGAETRQQCRKMLARLESGETEISHRNFVLLEIIERIKRRTAATSA